MTRVLLTGFAPFEGESTNPSWQAVRAAAADPPAGLAVSAVELPCVYGASGGGGGGRRAGGAPPPTGGGRAGGGRRPATLGVINKTT
ncbi:hypothetical protein ACFWIY_32355, partial [Streptomyces sioyaensis]